MAPPGNQRAPRAARPAHWAGRGHVGAFLIQLGSLILINLALWGFFAWSAIQFAERKAPPASVAAPL